MEHKRLTFYDSSANCVHFVPPNQSGSIRIPRCRLLVCKNGSQCKIETCAFAHSNKDLEERIQKSRKSSTFPFTDMENFMEDSDGPLSEKEVMTDDLLAWSQKHQSYYLRLYMTEPKFRSHLFKRVAVSPVLNFNALL